MSTIKKIPVLIVDDSNSMRKIVKNIVSGITELQFETQEARNGAEAMLALQEAHLANEDIGLVILDWMMPVVSGLEFLERTRSSQVFHDRPAIIMLTAETYADQIEACKKFRVEQYLTKPFAEGELIDAVLRIFNRGKLQNAV
jgi:CheY-like chemotaxis protein